MNSNLVNISGIFYNTSNPSITYYPQNYTITSCSLEDMPKKKYFLLYDSDLGALVYKEGDRTYILKGGISDVRIHTNPTHPTKINIELAGHENIPEGLLAKIEDIIKVIEVTHKLEEK